MADDLARRGSGLYGSDAERVNVPLGSLNRELLQYFLTMPKSKWSTTTTCAIWAIWPSYNKNRTTELLNRSRAVIARITAVCTDHCLIGEHAARLGAPFTLS